MDKKGMVYLVGAGPGDPELLTIKGKARLKECEVVIYDRLASDYLLDLVPGECEKIYVGKEVGNHGLSQETINEIIVKKALEGKRVVRLKGGDPFVFGRGGEEVLALQKEGIPYQVIPGITSAIAAAAYAGIPVTHRGVSRSFHVIAGHTKDWDNQLADNYETLARLEGTLIFLMGMGNLSLIVNELCRYGKDVNTPVAVVSNATTARQKTVKGTLGTICGAVSVNNIKAPAVIIVGEAAGLEMENTIKGRLYGKRIGVTGTEKLAGKLSRRLGEHGAYVENLSFLYVKEADNRVELEHAITNLKEYTWVVFTSTNGVDIFFKYLKENHIDYRKFCGISFAVVGSGTRDTLLRYGFIADYMPETYTTAALANGLANLLKEGDKVLIPRALKGSGDLTDILDARSVPFTEIKIYTIEIDAEKYKRVTSGLVDYDYITFASASGVEGFYENLGEEIRTILKKTRIVCIGDVTVKKLKDYGIRDYITAGEYSVAGLVESILSDAGK